MLPVPLRYSCSPQMMLCPPEACRPANSTPTRTAGLGSLPLTLPLLLPLLAVLLPLAMPFTEFAAGGDVFVETCVNKPEKQPKHRKNRREHRYLCTKKNRPVAMVGYIDEL